MSETPERPLPVRAGRRGDVRGAAPPVRGQAHAGQQQRHHPGCPLLRAGGPAIVRTGRTGRRSGAGVGTGRVELRVDFPWTRDAPGAACRAANPRGGGGRRAAAADDVAGP